MSERHTLIAKITSWIQARTMDVCDGIPDNTRMTTKELETISRAIDVVEGKAHRRNVIGETFGIVTVLREVPRYTSPQGIPLRVFECRCACGKICNKRMSQLSGRTKVLSCGCVRDQKTIARNLKHGFAARDQKIPEYYVWRSMRQRCGNKNNTDYQNYGARGIRVSERWNDFAAFFADMGPRPSDNYSLDRIDVNAGYSPDNCRWATAREQRLNQRRMA